MSTAIVRAEIARFLESSDPEVLCISGRWGVGKTFAWQKFLLDAIGASKFKLGRYAYASLFGINSLAELRFALVENTVTAASVSTGPDAWTLRDILKKGEQTLIARTMVNALSSAIRFKDAGDAFYRAAFLTIRGQLICLDDLERKGKGIEIKEILGLASMLREQRDCKLVLLFNKDAFPEGDREELEEQLEKVVDTFLTFEPTSTEAAAIAIEGEDAVSTELRARIDALSISNIRVIKKIERWARRLAEILAGYDPSIINQAVSTVVLVGWSYLQKRDAPPLAYLRRMGAIMTGVADGEWDDIIAKWRDPLRAYGYQSTDAFDLEIIDSINRGYFDEAMLKRIADKMKARLLHQDKVDAFSKAWDLYHGDLTASDDLVLDTIYTATVENLEVVSPSELNSSVEILRLHGRGEQADKVIQQFIDLKRGDTDFFDDDHDPFLHRKIDSALRLAVETARIEIGDDRDPVEMLKKMAQNRGYDPGRDTRRLARLTVAEWVAVFDSGKGRDVFEMMRWAKTVVGHQGDQGLRSRLNQAMEEIGKRSPMQRIKLQQWGHLPKGDQPEEDA